MLAAPATDGEMSPQLSCVLVFNEAASGVAREAARSSGSGSAPWFQSSAPKSWPGRPSTRGLLYALMLTGAVLGEWLRAAATETLGEWPIVEAADILGAWVILQGAEALSGCEAVDTLAGAGWLRLPSALLGCDELVEHSFREKGTNVRPFFPVLVTIQAAKNRWSTRPLLSAPEARSMA